MQSNLTPHYIVAIIFGTILCAVILIPISSVAATSLSVFPVILIAWYFGMRMAIAAALLAPMIHLPLLMIFGDFDWQTTIEQGGPIALIIGLTGAIIGRLREVDKAKHHPPQESNDDGAFQFQERLKALQAVGLQLSGTANIESLCRQAVELGRSQLGFDRLGIWLVDDNDPNYRIGSFGTDESGQLRNEWGVRLQMPQDDAFMKMLSGTVPYKLWQDAPLYNHQGEIIGHGWNAMTVLWGDDRGVGWLAIDNLILQQPSTPHLLELLRLYGSTLGHLIQRKQTEATLHEFQEKLKSLQEVSLELSRAQTIKSLCQQAIELGRSQLGFDRLGIWLVDDTDTEYMLGAYGTDEQGGVRDEWGVRVAVPKAEKIRELLDGQIRFHLWDETPLYNHRQQVVGTGWVAMTVLWGDDRGMGWLSADNLIARQSIKHYQLELLHLYGSTLGHLIRRKQAEAALHEFQEKLKTLQDISLQLSKAESFESLCRQAIELGRRHLGFDRLGIWLADETDADYMLGVYGTAEDGTIRDEIGLRFPLPPISAYRDMLIGKMPYYVRRNEPLFDHQHEIVGYGWNALTVLWGDDRGIGWLIEDNLIDQQALTPQHLELLSLYGSTLGHLIRRKQAEVTLHEFQEKLKALQQISVHLAKVESVKILCRQAVELGRSQLGFDRLGIWLVDDGDPDFMLGAFGTDEFGQVRDEWGVRLPLAPPEVREMLSGKTPYHLWDSVQLYNHQQQAVGTGWAAMTVLWGDDRGMGWLSVDNLLNRQPVNMHQLELLHLYGSTLGHLIRRKLVEETLREFLEKLKALQTVSLELSKADTFANLCRQAIERGQRQLGFDRLSIWLVDEDDPDYMFGAYGTDEHGKLRDERRVRIKLPQSEAFRDVLSGHIPHYIWEDTPLHNHNHEVVGTGWNATTVLWGDDRGIGWLSADNLIHGRPATPQLLELLSLYGSTLGHLIRRKRSQDALLGSEERFRALYRDNPSMFFTLDMDGTIISVNEFGAQQLGYAIDELEGQSMLTVYHDDDKASVQAQLKHCVANPGQIFEWDLRNVRKDGSVLWVEKFARAVKSPTNELHILTVCQDITERKLAEQQRLELAVEREKVGFLQGFLGSMAHDLKTPAAGIEMNLAILDGLTDSDDAKRWIEMMNKQLEDLTTIINDVLTIARLETLPDLFFESVNINQLIVDIQMSLQSRITTKGLTLNLALDDNLPVVHASRDELYRALMNLLENAIKYTPEQGTVSIRTSSSDSQVMAEISDSGIGISESHLSRIFDEFYRAENGRAFASGTGLGLAITKKIIDLHQGTIVVESIVGEGTTFRISLPEMA